MLSCPAAIKVYLCTVPCDMRRFFDGLSLMAEHIIRCNPFLCGEPQFVAPAARAHEYSNHSDMDNGLRPGRSERGAI